METLLEKELRTLIVERVEFLKKRLETNPFENLAEVRYIQGQLYILRDFDDLIDAAKTEVAKQR